MTPRLFRICGIFAACTGLSAVTLCAVTAHAQPPPTPTPVAISAAVKPATDTAATPGQIDDVVGVTCCAKHANRPAHAPPCPEDALDTREGSGSPMRTASIDAEADAAEKQFLLEVAHAEKTCLGLPIADVELQDCIGTRCQDEVRRNRFISLMDLKVGRPLAAGQLATARERLLKTDFFRIPHVFCRIQYGRAKIAFKVLGNTFVRRIRLHGNEKVYAEELRGRLIFQPGNVLRPRSVEGHELLQRQCLVIETLYHKRGHEDAVVHIETRNIGIGLIGVDIAIDEGIKHRVSRYPVTIEDPPKRGRSEDGLQCKDVSEKDIRRVSGLDEEDVFAGRLRVKARSKIRRYLRMMGYSKPRITIEHKEASQEVATHVKLGRCSVVRMLSRESEDGIFRQIRDDDLLAAMSFSESGVFDLDEAERSRRAVHATLENRGALFADVRMDFRKVPRAAKSRVDAAVSYFITTRYPAQIRGLRITGLKHFSMKDVNGVIGTRRYDIFTPGGFLQVDQMLGDLSRLKQFYESEGFFEFRYSLQRSTTSRYKGLFDKRHYSSGDNDVWEYLLPDRGFRVTRPEGEHFIYVEVPIEEGRRSQLTKLNFVGTKGIKRSTIRELVGLQVGGVISYRRLLESVATVERHYHDQGYFRMRLLLECWGRGYSGAGVAGVKSLGRENAGDLSKSPGMAPPTVGLSGPGKSAKPDDAEPSPWSQGKSENRCSQALMLAEKVSIRMTVEEGHRVQTGEVFISGNFDTSDTILLRDLPKSGEAFSKPRLFESQRRLRNTGLFDSVTFDYIGADETPVRDNIAVVVRVVESQSRNLQVATGFQTVNADRQDNVTGTKVVTTPSIVVDHIEQLTSAQQRLTTGYGSRLGAVLPSLLLTVGGSFVERNLWGEGVFMELHGQIGGTFAADTLLELVTPELFQAYWMLVFPRFLDSNWSLNIVAPYYNRDHATLTIDIDEVGGAIEARRRFGRLSFRAGLNLAFNSTVEVLKNAPDLGFSFQQKALTGVTFDSTDSPLNPTRGIYASATAAFINAQIIDALAPPTLGSFVKVDLTGKWFAQFANNWTIATLLRLGGAYHLDLVDNAASRLPLNERYRLGGALGVRGYTTGGIRQYNRNGTVRGVQNPGSQVGSDGTLLPYACADRDKQGDCEKYDVEDDGDVMVSGSIELRTPPVFFDPLRLAFFYDIGGIALDFQDLGSHSLRQGIGIGFRFLISGQLPVRLDISTPLGTRCLEPGVAGDEACVEEEDTLQFSVAMLYAF